MIVLRPEPQTQSAPGQEGRPRPLGNREQERFPGFLESRPVEDNDAIGPRASASLREGENRVISPLVVLYGVEHPPTSHRFFNDLMMVARDGVEPPTPAFSGLRSTT